MQFQIQPLRSQPAREWKILLANSIWVLIVDRMAHLGF
jgi:hypothetical protein